MVLETDSDDVFERLRCRLVVEDVFVSADRFRLRGLPFVEEVFDTILDLEPLREGLCERWSLSELIVPPRRCQSCLHCVQDSMFQPVFRSKQDPEGGSVQAVTDDFLQGLCGSRFVRSPLRLWLH